MEIIGYIYLWNIITYLVMVLGAFIFLTLFGGN
jgi:hypothetical protein